MRILDATAGYRMMWLDKHQKDTLYVDIRPEVNPDIVMNVTEPNFFRNKEFNLIIFDPLFKNMGTTKNKGAKEFISDKYGSFTTEYIRNFIPAAFKEFCRILKDDGFILFKWNDTSIKFSSITQFWEPYFEPLVAQRMTGNGKTQTYWVSLKKKFLE